MRVLYLNSGNLYGGIETLLATLARHRADCPSLEPSFAICFEGKIAAELRGLSVPVRILGPVRVSRPWTAVPARKRLAEAIDELKPDVVISHGPWTHAILGPVVRQKGIPLVFWSHDVALEPLPWLERLARRIPPDLVICNSNYTRNGFQGLYPGVPSRVVYCPVSPAEKAASNPAARTEFRSRYGAADPATAVILQVSRLDPHKGHDLHLSALGQLRDTANWACWMVAGAQRQAEKEYLEKLKAQAVQLGIESRVHFLGWQPDVAPVFAAADIFCQPNTAPEPFGLTFVEALMRELPVVSTTMGGALEIVEPTCGTLVPPNDPTQLAKALRDLILDPGKRARLGRRGPARATELCNPAQQLSSLLTLLDTHTQNGVAA